jgi:hypothetical protein
VWAGETIHLFADSEEFKTLGCGGRIYWSLPEICLTSSICYKRADLLRVQGAPINFIGWGFNDVSVAAKIISLNNFVVPVIGAGVYHLNHIVRSKEGKYGEFKANRLRYEKMLQMEQVDTFREYINDLN